MKVKELVERLQNLDQNREITIQNRDGEIYAYSIGSVFQAYENQGDIFAEYEGDRISEEDIEELNLSKENIKYIATHDPVYIIKPE